MPAVPSDPVAKMGTNGDEWHPPGGGSRPCICSPTAKADMSPFAVTQFRLLPAIVKLGA
jgi:hypothetical protein